MNSRSPRKGASVRLGCASALGVVSRRRGTPRHYGRIDRADGHPAPPRLSPIPPRHSSRFSIHRRIPQGNREYHLVPGCACRSTYGPNPTAARFWVSTDSEPDPFLDGLREGMRAFPPPAKVTKPSALFIRQPGRGTWRNTNRVTSNGGAPRRQADCPFWRNTAFHSLAPPIPAGR